VLIFARLVRAVDREHWLVPNLSRSQILVYGAVAIALLLLGARWIRSADSRGAPAGEISVPAAGNGAGEDSGTVAVGGESGRDVFVHVAGGVREPGVFRLPAGSRVEDAIERAGGAVDEAGLEAINLAAVLGDGQQVVVPAVGADGAAMGATAAAAADGPISLGSATLEDLETIEGIGPVTAQSILDYRDEQGGLSSVDELDQVSGIGPATMEALRSRLQP
jgi:competence protein ComEA